jgi:hypothetical protein
MWTGGGSGIGYAVTDAGDIFKTTDGGDNWTDTTDNVTGTVKQNATILCISATKFIYAGNSNGIIQVYDNSTNTVTSVFQEERMVGCNGIVETTDGDIYVSLAQDGTTPVGQIIICRSDDSGATWSARNVSVTVDTADSAYYGYNLEELDDNELIISNTEGSNIFKMRTP